MTGRSALVLGASGMVGLPLSRRLIEEGWKVFGAARFGDPAKHAEVEKLGACPIRFDVTKDDPAALPDVDVVFLEIWDPQEPELIWADQLLRRRPRGRALRGRGGRRQRVHHQRLRRRPGRRHGGDAQLRQDAFFDIDRTGWPAAAPAIDART